MASEANPHRVPVGTRVQHAVRGKCYWRVKIAEPNRWAYEHRVVMAQTCGRPLRAGEHVHHRNGDGLDNRPENLQIVTHAEHMRIELSLPAGMWTRNYAACVACGTTARKHLGFGHCSRCYQRLPGNSWRDKHASRK